MDKINFFPDDLDVQNKKIILRLDLNVPLKDKLIKDFTRIDLCLPLIKRLVKKKAKIIIISHLGRPKGNKDPALSLTPIYKYIKKSLQANVYFFMGNFDSEVNNKFSHLKEGEIILIENIRYFKEETEDDDNFSKKLGSLGDIFINDAFSCSHRKHASVHKITKFIKKSYAGPLLQNELNAINLVIQNKKEPVTCIIGGSKISTKINVISSLIEKVNNIVIVGAMANNFLVYKKIKVGKSLIEDNTKEINLEKNIEENNNFNSINSFEEINKNINNKFNEDNEEKVILLNESENKLENDIKLITNSGNSEFKEINLSKPNIIKKIDNVEKVDQLYGLNNRRENIEELIKPINKINDTNSNLININTNIRKINNKNFIKNKLLGANKMNNSFYQKKYDENLAHYNYTSESYLDDDEKSINKNKINLDYNTSDDEDSNPIELV